MRSKIVSLFLLMLISARLSAQVGEISGIVTDNKTGEAIVGAPVSVMKDNIPKGGAVTDVDGKFTIKPIDTGEYTLTASYVGYKKFTIINIKVQANKTTSIKVSLDASSELQSVMIISYKSPLVDHFSPGPNTTFQSSHIEKMPTHSVNSVVGTAAGVYNSGGNLSIQGSRSGGTSVLVDGVQLNSGTYIMSNDANNTQPQAQFYDPSVESYKKINENDFMNVKANPLSTMSVDVDRAGYSNVRRFLNEGQLPPADAVRMEEMINYFDYSYTQPNGDDPISINTELTDCPWNKDNKLLRIGIQAQKIDMENLPPANLVFLIDVSGSMESPERLPLLVEGMKMLVNNLRAKDKVSIVTYAGNAGLALPPTSGEHKQKILDVLDELEAGGSTAGGAGIQLAYKIAIENFIKGGNNRVILATDGDFNVGISNDNELEDLITEKRKSGVYLTCLGFGTDNYKDSRMEVLADKGNGNYDYIDNIQEARKTLVSEFGGTLFTVAKDVKSQIEFNPAKVQGYRLLGYEDRLLNDEDFKDDKKDAGDMGSGHVVTILYELIPAGIKSKDIRDVNDLKYQQSNSLNNADELATIKFRYKKPDGDKSTEIVHTIPDKTIAPTEVSENTRFASAVAMFGMLLRDSRFKGSSNYNTVIELAEASKTYDKDGYRSEFVRLVKVAKHLDRKTVSK